MLHRRSLLAGATLLGGLPFLGGIAAAGLKSAPAAIGFRHVMLFNFKDDVPDIEQQRLAAAIREHSRSPLVRSLLVGKNTFTGATGGPHFAWAAIQDFKDPTAYRAFARSPAHRDFMTHGFAPYRADVVALDLDQPFDRPIAETGGNGFRQLALFNFKATLDRAARQRVLAAIRAQGKLPGIATMVIGRNVLPHSDLSPLQWFVMTQCPSPADNDAFQKSAAHQDFIRAVFAPAHDALVVFDLLA
jgi:hypothetical protein